jgi:hypothetical protein
VPAEILSGGSPRICNHGCSVSGEVVGSGDCLAACGGLVEVRGGGRELRRRWKGAGVDLALQAPMAIDRSGQGKTGSARFHLPSRGTDGWGYRRTSTLPSRLAGTASCQTVASRPAGQLGGARVHMAVACGCTSTSMGTHFCDAYERVRGLGA